MRKLFVFICIIVTAASLSWSEEAVIRVGMAKADITPPIGGNTTGYSSAQPTVGVHDPLYAKVLVLNSATSTVAIVSWDLCIYGSPWLHRQMDSIGVDHLLILNTHTHAGPNLRDETFPSAEEPWRKTIEGRVVDAIQEAQKKLTPAFFAVGEGSIQLGYNRLVRQPGGYAITHFDNPDRVPYGPVDPNVGVIRITDELGEIRCVLVCYALHPVVLGPKNRMISADFPGVLSRIVTEKLGENTQCMFIQGGAGDINPLILARTGDPEQDFPLVERTGELLAEEVLKTLDAMSEKKGKSSGFSIDEDTIEVEQRFDKEEKIKLSVTSILLNQEIGIVSMPGEPFHLFQWYLRSRSGLPFTFLFGYSGNGIHNWPRYMPDLESAARGGYGASDSTLAAVGAGEQIINQGLVMLYEMRGRLLDHPQRHVLND